MPSQPLFARVLVANRGEIALRILRALHDLGLARLAVYAADDAASPHAAALRRPDPGTTGLARREGPGTGAGAALPRSAAARPASCGRTRAGPGLLASA